MHIQCERILLTQVYSSWPQQQRYENEKPSHILGNWYAQVLTFLQNEFLLIVHNQTLLTLIEFLDLSSPESYNQLFSNIRGKISKLLSTNFLSDDQYTELLNSVL